MSLGVTAHMIVKNEDRWVWYAIQSVLPYVDKLLVTDTGSTDNTLAVIASINSPKIMCNSIVATSRAGITQARQKQIDATTTPWIWIVDADEIYPARLAEEIMGAIVSDKYSIIVVRRHDLLGDIYHRQVESVGSYDMFGEEGHLLIRLMNKKNLSGLHVKGDYPLESYYAGSGACINDWPKRDVYITQQALYHTMYLKRSSQGRNLASMFNRSKYKVERGMLLTTPPPEVFKLSHPSLVQDVQGKRSLSYELAATIVTPIKNLVRRFK